MAWCLHKIYINLRTQNLSLKVSFLFIMVVLGLSSSPHCALIRPNSSPAPTHPSSNSSNTHLFTRRKALAFTASVVSTYILDLYQTSSPNSSAAALQVDDELQQEEDRLVQLFQVLPGILRISVRGNEISMINFGAFSFFLCSFLIYGFCFSLMYAFSSAVENVWSVLFTKVLFLWFY